MVKEKQREPMDELRLNNPAGADQASSLAAQVRTARILIVDDDPLICQLSQAILESHGFIDVEIADSGYAGLESISAREPDLVLLDFCMSDLDGAEVCRRIRAKPELADLPILVQTATVARAEIDRAFAAGATDFLSKPIN